MNAIFVLSQGSNNPGPKGLDLFHVPGPDAVTHRDLVFPEGDQVDMKMIDDLPGNPSVELINPQSVRCSGIF